MRYNILFLEHGAKLIGGGHFSMLLLFKYMDRKKFNPILVSSNETLFSEKARELNVQVELMPISKAISSVYRNQIKFNPLFLFLSAFHIILTIIRLCFVIKRKDIHIVHPCDNLSRIICGISAKITRVKAVCHVHDDLSDEIFINRFLKFIMLLFMDKIIAVSDKVRTSFKYRGKNSSKITTIYNGIDLNVFNVDRVIPTGIREKNHISKDKILIAIIGSLISIKGHIVLFRALKQLKKERFQNISCIVIGDGPEFENLKAYIEENSLDKEVVFLGFRDDIPNVLKEADILILPSFSESFGRVFAEGMAMGIPAIGTAVGGIPEAIEDKVTGLLVPPGDSDSLAKAIKLLVVNPDIRKKMGEEGQKRVKKMFNNEENIKKTEAIYLELTKNSCLKRGLKE